MTTVSTHYWEDALRHSVYLTLVRDKIDQLISRDVIHQEKKSPHHEKNPDDHDLWDRIKKAPFDRIETNEPANLGDVTIMSKGRLLEEKNVFRFIEDERSKEKCTDRCMDGVRALWSVKRSRQRDDGKISGKYHHELTFSVVTHAPKLIKKPHENPARTFTVRESNPETVVEEPREHRSLDIALPHSPRPAKTVWFHKNIVPVQRHGRYYHGTDRLFTSLFSDDEYEVPKRPSYSYAHPPHSQYAKVGYVGSPSENQKYKKPYIYKPHVSMKYQRPPMAFPPMSHPQHHYLDIDAIGVVSSPYVPQPSEPRPYVPMKPVKTGLRPAVLPTPSDFSQKKYNTTFLPTVVPNVKNGSTTALPANPTEPTTYHTKQKHMPIKINYFTDSIRPPVYNAPPGVFVTMDKKPFKPMPPIKMQKHPLKTSRPIDFRPSPQLLDIQFSEPDPLHDGAFRPIAVHYSSNETKEAETTVAQSTEKDEKIVNTKINSEVGSKRVIKNKSQRITTTTTTEIPVTTVAPQREDSDYDLSWGNLLSAFTKTTPMAMQQTQRKDETSTTLVPKVDITTEELTTVQDVVDEKSTPDTSTIASTTQKRTRPPPKFKTNKTNKVRKHKRVTTTTTTTTTTQPPEKVRKPSSDLTPQASSAASSGTRATARWTLASNSITQSVTTTTAMPTTTESRPTFTTHKPTVIEEKPMKNKNRYRQSTLMIKGTSVKHDKWNPANIEKLNSKTVIPPTGQFPPRRIESNFHGYTKPVTPQTYTTYSTESEEDEYDDYFLTTTSDQQKIVTTEPTFNNGVIRNGKNEYFNLYSQESYTEGDLDVLSKEENTKAESVTQSVVSSYPKPTNFLSYTSNEQDNDESVSTEQPVVETTSYAPKNKTKCKKKNKLGTTETAKELEEEPLTTTTENNATPDIFDEIFSAFSDESPQVSDNSTAREDTEAYDESSFDNHDFTDMFLDTYEVDENKHRNFTEEDDDDEYDQDASIDEGDVKFVERGRTNDESNESDDKMAHERPHPYSIFELMAMD